MIRIRHLTQKNLARIRFELKSNFFLKMKSLAQIEFFILFFYLISKVRIKIKTLIQIENLAKNRILGL